MARRPLLRELARRAGILPGWRDMRDRQRRTTDATREALLAAMGFDASTEADCAHGLARLAQRRLGGITPAARVLTEAAGHITFRVPSPAAPAHTASDGTVRSDPRYARARRVQRIDWSVEVWEDDPAPLTAGAPADITASLRLSGSIAAGAAGRTLRVALPRPLGHGYHRVRVRLDGPGMREGEPGRAAGACAQQLLVVTPASCVPVTAKIARRRVFGLVVNLWGVRSGHDRGAGDTGELHALVDLTADAGGDFVGMNPLHALRNRGVHISPYSPISRLFRNPLYIDLDAVPELADSAPARALLESAGIGEETRRLRQRARVDYEGVMRIRDAALDALHATFRAQHGAGDTARARAFRHYREEQGAALRDFATFLALDEHFAHAAGRRDWRTWPAAYRDPRSPDVLAFRTAHAARVERHMWVQFELDRQLAGVTDHARERGLAIGLYPDLAIGSAAGGSDAWAFPGLFVSGASLGAPPDDYSATGQNWALPPVHPLRLVDDRYGYWILLLRNALAHAGALRIDHVMGLFRQFWIPQGRPGGEGAYVRFPAADLLAILALESHRHGAIVIGEDLGTVPPGVAPAMRRRAILSSRVMIYERDRHGGFRASARWSKRALVTANTHDNAPLAGFWSGRDLELRGRLGTLPPREHAFALRQRDADRAALLARLVAENVLPAGATSPDATTLCAAVYRYLARTPSPLLGLALDDLTAETEPVNVPGVTPDRHPSWTRRQRIPLEAIATDPHARAALDAVRQRARRHTHPRSAAATD